MLLRASTIANRSQYLNITLDKPSFFTDEFIQGKVDVNAGAQLVLNDIRISFFVCENWISKGEDLQNIGDMHNECLLSMNLDIRRKLNITTSLISLNPGRYIFPFYFKIPKVVQACFEYPANETRAYIRYSLNAQIVSPYVQGATTSYILLKSRYIPQNKQLFFTNSTNTHKWGLFNSGSTTLNISILNGTDNFKNGENVNINIDIDNSKGKLSAQECKITLARIIKLKSKYGKVIKEIKKDCSSQIYKTPVKVNEKKNFNVAFNLMKTDTTIFDFKKDKPPYMNITDMTYFLPSIKAFLIECDYSLKATLYFTSFVKHDDRPRIIIPIRICHQSLLEYNTEVQNNLAKQNQYNNPPPANQYYNNQNINNPAPMNLNRSLSLMNNNPNPLSLDNNDNNEDIDLPSQEEIEKPYQNDNNNNINDLGAPTFDAPAPIFQPKP